jgi:hypothetical protein
MNDFDLLIRLIIPAVLLVFWALSNLFNRDNTAAKDGMPRPSPLGPRPSSFPPTPRDRLTGSPTMTPPRYAGAPKEDVLIIRAETPPPRSGSQPRRNTGRPRREPSPGPRRPVETPAPRPREQVGGRISADVNQALPTSIDLRPLSQSVGDAKVDAASASAASSFGPPAPAARPSSLPDLRAILSDPDRVREAFLLNVVLGPPVSRGGRRR